MEDVNKIVVETARRLPSIVLWIGLGVLCGLTLALNGTNLTIPYILGGFSIVLWYLFYRAYNMTVSLFNKLSVIKLMSELNELQGDGTLLDETCLTEYGKETDDNEE